MKLHPISIWIPMSLSKKRSERSSQTALFYPSLIGSILFWFRLNTIANYDRVMVIDQGNVVEFGTPLELLSTDLLNPTIDRETLFATLVKKNGQKNAAFILAIAKLQYDRMSKLKWQKDQIVMLIIYIG